MQTRLLVLLLMPLFVVGNSLAHSHSTATHQSPTEGRVHFHVGSAPELVHHHRDPHDHANHDHHGHDHHGHDHHGHDHHGHDHEGDDHESDEPESAPVEHDSDAVYVVAADFVFTAFDRISIEIDSHTFVATVICLLTDFRPSLLRDRPPLATTTPLPLYLLYAALRL